VLKHHVKKILALALDGRQSMASWIGGLVEHRNGLNVMVKENTTGNWAPVVQSVASHFMDW